MNYFEFGCFSSNDRFEEKESMISDEDETFAQDIQSPSGFAFGESPPAPQLSESDERGIAPGQRGSQRFHCNRRGLFRPAYSR